MPEAQMSPMWRKSYEIDFAKDDSSCFLNEQIFP